MMIAGCLDWPCDEARAAHSLTARRRTTWVMMFVQHWALNLFLSSAVRPGALCLPWPSTVWHDTAMTEAPVGDVKSAWNMFYFFASHTLLSAAVCCRAGRGPSAAAASHAPCYPLPPTICCLTVAACCWLMLLTTATDFSTLLFRPRRSAARRRLQEAWMQARGGRGSQSSPQPCDLTQAGSNSWV